MVALTGVGSHEWVVWHTALELGQVRKGNVELIPWWRPITCNLPLPTIIHCYRHRIYPIMTNHQLPRLICSRDTSHFLLGCSKE